jgi:hypothetical protein
MRTVKVAHLNVGQPDPGLSTGTGAILFLVALWLLTEYGRQKLRQ